MPKATASKKPKSSGKMVGTGKCPHCGAALSINQNGPNFIIGPAP